MKKVFAMAAVAALCLALGVSIGACRRDGLTLVFESGE
jgi:hypothetical protein